MHENGLSGQEASGFASQLLRPAGSGKAKPSSYAYKQCPIIFTGRLKSDLSLSLLDLSLVLDLSLPKSVRDWLSLAFVHLRHNCFDIAQLL